MTRKPTNSSLTEVDVRAMRLQHALGQASPKQLAAAYKVAVETVRKILRWETWGWVSEEGPGATHEQWAGGKPALTDDAIAASKARFMAGLSGPARLQQEVTALKRTDKLLDELAGHENESGLQSRIPPVNGPALPTDGGKDGNGV